MKWPLAWASTVEDMDAALNAACEALMETNQELADALNQIDIMKHELRLCQSRACDVLEENRMLNSQLRDFTNG